jgi:hypothetical protein
MTEHEFEWEGSEDPSDLSGVARFRLNSESVAIKMPSFSQATALNKFIENACESEKQKTLDRAISSIYAKLNEQRYD